MNDSLLYWYTTFSLFIHQLLEMWIVMAIVNSDTMNISTHLFGMIFVILLSIYLDEELLGHVTILYFTFEKYQLCLHYLSVFFIPTINIFHFPDRVTWCTRIFNSDGIWFFCFSFAACGLVAILRNHWLIQHHEDFSLCFPLKVFSCTFCPWYIFS